MPKEDKCARCALEVTEQNNADDLCDACTSEVESIRAARKEASVHETKMSWDREYIDKEQE